DPHLAFVPQPREHLAQLAHHRGGQRVVPAGIVELDQHDVFGGPRDRDFAHGATAMRSAKPVRAWAPMLACSNRPKPSAPSHTARATWSMLPNGIRGTIVGSSSRTTTDSAHPGPFHCPCAQSASP